MDVHSLLEWSFLGTVTELPQLGKGFTPILFSSFCRARGGEKAVGSPFVCEASGNGLKTVEGVLKSIIDNISIDDLDTLIKKRARNGLCVC